MRRGRQEVMDIGKERGEKGSEMRTKAYLCPYLHLTANQLESVTISFQGRDVAIMQLSIRLLGRRGEMTIGGSMKERRERMQEEKREEDKRETEAFSRYNPNPTQESQT